MFLILIFSWKCFTWHRQTKSVEITLFLHACRKVAAVVEILLEGKFSLCKASARKNVRYNKSLIDTAWITTFGSKPEIAYGICRFRTANTVGALKSILIIIIRLNGARCIKLIGFSISRRTTLKVNVYGAVRTIRLRRWTTRDRKQMNWTIAKDSRYISL